MNIVINGKSQELDSRHPAIAGGPALGGGFRGNSKNVINLSDIVSSFCKNPKHVITELNGTIVPSDQWLLTHPKDGDSLEIVTFVGGG